MCPLRQEAQKIKLRVLPERKNTDPKLFGRNAKLKYGAVLLPSLGFDAEPEQWDVFLNPKWQMGHYSKVTTQEDNGIDEQRRASLTPSKQFC